MSLEIAYADGQLAALVRYKLSWPAPTNPTVAGSAVLRARAPQTMAPEPTPGLQPPTTPQQVAQIFNAHEQGETRNEPRRKLSADICTTCRKARHYGPCNAPRPIPTKAADFNINMTGGDPSQGNNPSTSPHYHSATSDTALARARDTRRPDEQAATAFADLFRHQGINNMADEPGQMTGSLSKVADDETLRARRSDLLYKMYGMRPRASKLSAFMLPDTGLHSRNEQRGPTVNPYEEQRTRLSPPVAFGDEGLQRIDRAFNQIDNAADTTNIGGGAGTPDTGPAVLG